MIEQSILNIRRDEYTKGMADFLSNYVSTDNHLHAGIELLKLMNLHFNLTLDQYDLDRKNKKENNK